MDVIIFLNISADNLIYFSNSKNKYSVDLSKYLPSLAQSKITFVIIPELERQIIHVSLPCKNFRSFGHKPRP